jgi:bifunctional DNA-binding transcriptional regulator/antitoxin component of YhaV-PrlF toxin-antitoxin module
MYFQQRTAVLLEHDSKEQDFYVYKHPWKLITIPKSFQNFLGVDNGDVVIIRKNLLSKTMACIISGESPLKDDGTPIVRVNKETRNRININIGDFVLIEKIDVIPADEVTIEWYYQKLPKRFMDTSLKDKISQLLHEFIFQELADLPLMKQDRFTIDLPIPTESDNHYYKIVYWIRSFRPRFPVIKLDPETELKIF